MTEALAPTPTQAPNETELVAAIHRILEASAEPLTPSKIRAHLSTNLRTLSIEELEACLQRRVDANVLYEYSPYRSQQHRYWDRPLVVHLAALVRAALAEGPLTCSQLRRKLPDYARTRAEEVLQEELSRGRIHRHPRAGSRTGERYGLQPPDAREPLRQELARLFDRLQTELGFEREQLRVAALELLHDEQWGPGAAAQRQPAVAAPPEEPPAAPSPPQATPTSAEQQD